MQFPVNVNLNRDSNKVYSTKNVPFSHTVRDIMIRLPDTGDVMMFACISGRFPIILTS